MRGVVLVSLSVYLSFFIFRSLHTWLTGRMRFLIRTTHLICNIHRPHETAALSLTALRQMPLDQQVKALLLNGMCVFVDFICVCVLFLCVYVCLWYVWSDICHFAS